MAKRPTKSEPRFTKVRQIRVDDEFEQAIETLRKQASPIPSISEVIRDAVLAALARQTKGRT